MKSNSRDKYIKQIIQSLIKDGEQILRNARNDSALPTPQKHNMVDAYGAAVYYKGEIVAKTYLNETPETTGSHHGWAKMGIPPRTGREDLDDFFAHYKVANDGIYLVCVNAVFYSSILEKGSFKKKYRVMSGTKADLERISEKYKGQVFSLG